jgi:hypothetical protein
MKRIKTDLASISSVLLYIQFPNRYGLYLNEILRS